MGKATELLLNNYIDKDMQEIMKPLNIMQNMIFVKRYTIKDSFATSISRKDKIISITATIVMLFVHICSNITYILKVLSVLNSALLNFYTIMEIVFFSSGLIANVAMNIYCSESNVTILLKMQEAHRITKKFQDDTRSLKLWNWVHVSFVIGYALVFTMYYLIYYHTPTSTFLVVLCVNTNVIYGIRIVCFLTTKLNVWTKMLKKQDMKSKYKCIKMSKAYLDLMEAYSLFQKTYNILLAFNTIDSFCHILIYVQVFISVNTNVALRAFVSTSWKLIATWVIKNLAMQVLVGAGCERFYIAVEEAQVACVQQLNKKDCPDYEKRTWWRLVQSHWGWSRTTGCGLFKLDALMPLRLLETLATYTIVLLQFAFL